MISLVHRSVSYSWIIIVIKWLLLFNIGRLNLLISRIYKEVVRTTLKRIQRITISVNEKNCQLLCYRQFLSPSTGFVCYQHEIGDLIIIILQSSSYGNYTYTEVINLHVVMVVIIYMVIMVEHISSFSGFYCCCSSFSFKFFVTTEKNTLQIAHFQKVHPRHFFSSFFFWNFLFLFLFLRYIQISDDRDRRLETLKINYA